MSEIILNVNNLSKSFKNNIAVNNVSFKVYNGDIYGFLGPNGSGKTTTLRMILNLIKPDNGKITVCGYNAKDNFKNYIENIGSIIEVPKFHPYLTGEENLILMAKLVSIPYSKVLSILDLVGLSSSKDKKFSYYSLGMKQRLGIANALLGNPKLIILDEPTNGLDPQGIREIRDLIIKLSRENNITFIISTHLLYEVEQICNRVGILKNGELLTEGYVDTLISSNTEEITLHTASVELSIKLLKTLNYVKHYKKTECGLVINLSKGYTSDLIKTLVNNNIDIKYIIPLKTSLEDVFIDITKEDLSND